MTTRSLRSLPSRNSIVINTRSRRSSLGPDEDAFASDDSLDSPISIDDAPLGYFPPPRQQNPDPTEHTEHMNHTDHTDDDLAPARTSSTELATQSSDSTSTSKRRLMIDDVPSSSTAGLGRSLSSSSRVTIPRSHSPYTGPTQPSHPYQMYPQMTRASSVNSVATSRPGSETLFVARGGPQHPYQMYPQNTVTEETEDITTHGIPLGFPRSNFTPSAGGSSSDHGDIVGLDGHVEQLPPYTRYALNTVAKGNMDDINARRASQAEPQSASQSLSPSVDTVTNAAAESSTGSTGLLRPTELFEQETEAQRARKEGYRGNWKDTLMRPTFANVPLWGLLVVVIIVVLAGVVGGVVGGVIGNKQGVQYAYANGALTTVWLDAVPTSIGPGTAPLPTGHFQIPFNQTEEINDCIIKRSEYGASWGCMDIAYIGVNVFLDSASGTYQAAFEDFSVNTADFRYGPQPPDFNGTAFTLQPMQDKDAGELGVAMFFSVLFDKISIVPEYALKLTPDKRSVDPYQFSKRGPAVYDGSPLEPGERPWFCFWNSTINEFFFYLTEDTEKPADNTSTSGSSKYAPTTSSSQTITPPASLSPTTAMQYQEYTMTTAPTSSATSFLQYNPTYNPSAQPTGVIKRGYDTSAANMTNYPKVIKMVEKRKPADANVVHVQPYCQLMQVLNDWNIVPVASVSTICVDEKQFPTATLSPRSDRLIKRGDRNVVADLESYCICEWTSQ